MSTLLHETWKCYNKMVIPWRLTCSMMPSIKQSVMWMKFGSDLIQRFSHGDKFRITNLQEEIQSCRHGDSTIFQFYTRLQILWKELLLYRTILGCTYASPCTCGLISKIQKERDDDCVIKFPSWTE